MNPGTNSGNPVNLVIIDSNLFFQTTDGGHGAELWKSDKTSAGTSMIKDINTSPGFSSNPSGFAELNGALCFTANDGAHGPELWKSDGSAAGTVMFADINPSGDGSPSWLTPFKNNLFFAATEPSHGNELWRTGDFSSPQTKITSYLKKTALAKKNSPKVHFRFRSDEPGSKFACKLDSGKWKSCKSPKAYRVKADKVGKRKWTFQVRATDKAGNVDGSPAKWVWRAKRKKGRPPAEDVTDPACREGRDALRLRSK